MISFNSAMQNEKIAVIGLVIIIVGALAVFLAVNYNEDIFKNIFDVKEKIELNDCVDLNYVGTQEDGTIFDSSYEDAENKTKATPINIFVSLNATETPPEEYSTYTSNLIKGFMEGLIGLTEGETSTIGPIPPEKGYGIKPKINDIINLTEYFGITYVFKIADIQEDAPMPEEYLADFGEGTTDLYTLREDWHYIGEIIETSYIYWDNSSVVTKINETLLWMYTTPTTDIGETFTWSDINVNTGAQTTFPENTSSITSMNDDTIIITHNPSVGNTIDVSVFTGFGYMPNLYTVESITDDIINASIPLDEGGNKTYMEFDRTATIERNETQNITYPAIPAITLEDTLFAPLRNLDSEFKWSLAEYADETLYFEVTIEKVYKTSQKES